LENGLEIGPYAQLNDETYNRHHEAAAKRPSKDAAQAPTKIAFADFGNCFSTKVGNSRLWVPSPFEARFARTLG
jgi:hypothetical protein